MKGYQVQLEKLRKDAAECDLIRDFAVDSVSVIYLTDSPVRRFS
ncbi:hypothetical protein [Bradyrhizobium sp. 139]|nr:hypothetical protein [Bradyrhizobium sp. 139]